MKWKIAYSKEAKKSINEQNIWDEVRSGIRKFLQLINKENFLYLQEGEGLNPDSVN